MSKAKSKKAPSNLSAEDMQAAATLKLQAWIEQIDEAERRSVGTWYDLPPGFERWHFVRCGLKTCHRAQMLAGTLREMGYQDAPRGVKCVGFESDQEGAIYLCVPHQIYRLIRDRKKGAQRSVASKVDRHIRGQVANINDQLGGKATVTVEGSTS